MALGYAWFDSYDSVGYVLTLHISPPYSLPIQAAAEQAIQKELDASKARVVAELKAEEEAAAQAAGEVDRM